METHIAAERDALAGFSLVGMDGDTWQGARSMRCHSREVLEAFKGSGHPAIAKAMSPDDLRREAYNLRSYRRLHPEEFGDVGISTRHGKLTLYRQP